MERTIYRKTLDLHKSGVQFTLQGFQTADNMSRTLELSLMASGDTIDLPLEQLMAVMYVTTPNATEPSINECTIKDNAIVCDVLPIVEEGITEVQLKLIDTRAEGAKGVLATPEFAIEVSKSKTNEESATQNTTFTALETALAKAKGVYDERFLRMELDTDCMFRAYYADGTVYESDVLKELFLKGDALVSQSYARGGTGVRAGEDTDNSMYYSQVSKSASLEANTYAEKSEELLEETRKHGVYTAFSVDFETGEVVYVSPSYTFNIDKETGELDTVGNTYTFEESIQLIVTEFLSQNGADINRLRVDVNALDSKLTTFVGSFTDIQKKVGSLEESRDSFANGLSALQEALPIMSSDIKDLQEINTRLDNEISSLITELSEFKDAINDYVIEQGKTVIYTNEAKTAGVVWEYRKWESGVLECWGSYQGKHDLTELNSNGFYSSGNITLNFPFEFISIPNVVLSGSNNTSTGATHFAVLHGSYNAYVIFRLVGLESKETLKNSVAEVFLNVKGRWK